MHKDNEPVDPTEWLAKQNGELRRAGCAMAAAALHVAAEHDGIHRLMLATAQWAQAVADEGGRGKQAATEPPPEPVQPLPGFHVDRTKIDDNTGRLEDALAATWSDYCRPKGWLNIGHGTLQDLFMRRGPMWGVECQHRVTPSEAMVAATVVQWLGTNCGREFLREAFSRAGWELVARPRPPE